MCEKGKSFGSERSMKFKAYVQHCCAATLETILVSLLFRVMKMLLRVEI